MKGMDGRLAGCMRWAREGRTDSLNKTWVAPESARMGEGVIAHKRAGGEGSSPSASSRETVRMKGRQPKEVGSRESQREGVDDRREASARESWTGGVLEERRFFLTTSR